MKTYWDARAYDNVSRNVQLQWGLKLLEKRNWAGNEVVLDAGAGSGNLTRFLAERVPEGRVYAVDADPNMIHQARANLSDHSNAQIIHSSMDSVDLPTKVDVIFSNAALHWIPDLEKVFVHFWQLLRPGGELLLECGGEGNVQRALSHIQRIMHRDEFKGYFTTWKRPWHFPSPEEVRKLLMHIGFREIQASLSNYPTRFADRQSFAAFVSTSIMKPFLECLPEPKKKRFLDTFLDEVMYLGYDWSIDFVRLRILARRRVVYQAFKDR
jgi:trans-aconitate 2-methyltransferase